MIEYRTEGKIIVLTGCTEEEEELDIPEYIEGMPVGKIDANSFNELPKLKKLILPKTLRVIGEYAFASCQNLSEIVFEEGLEVIDDWAFISCNISTILLPNSVKKIGENAFMGNECRDMILARKTQTEKKKIALPKKFNTAVFPIGLVDSIENITKDIIIERAKYYDASYEEVEEKNLDPSTLDLPFIFDNTEFLIALTSLQPLEAPVIKISKESEEIIGLYEEEDPDFLVLKVEILEKEIVFGEFLIKVPYLEEATFAIENIYSVEEQNGYRYFIHTCANLSCFGNGNLNREFAFNHFKELEGKFHTQLNHQLISEEIYLELINKLKEISLETLKDFFKQVNGSPILNYIIKVFKALLNDKDLDKNKIMQFIQKELQTIYETIGDYTSFEEICFNLKNATNFFTELTHLSLDELNQKYRVYIQDEKGKFLSIERIGKYRKDFIEDEFNYTLHADFLNYIYQVMDSINLEYSMKTYQE